MKNVVLFVAAVAALSAFAGTSAAAIKVGPGAMVIVWPNGTAQTRANVIAQGAVVPTLPDQDFLPPGNGVGAFGPYVFSFDFEASIGLVNRAHAIAAYNRDVDPPGAPVAKTLHVDCQRKGNARGALAPSRDGSFQEAAVGDTAVQDSFMIRIAPINATSANLIVNGEAMVQRNLADAGYARLDVIVYPDSNSCNLDPTSTGAGAVFVGRLFVDKDGIEKADGGWSAADFQVQVTTDRVRVRAVGLTKVINCPNSANLTPELIADATGGAPVPGTTPVMVTILSLLMAGAGWMAIRRSQARV